MKTSTQAIHNLICSIVFTDSMSEYYREQRESGKNIKPKRLRNCNAKVFETENYYILQSYKTIIAAIRKSDNVCINYMRHEYAFDECATGKTSTQHFYKFVKDYVPFGKCPLIYTYKAV